MTSPSAAPIAATSYSPRTGPDRARAERLRRVNAPTYRRKVKVLARSLYAFLQTSVTRRNPRLPLPTRDDVRALIHECLSPITFDDKRRSRDRRGAGDEAPFVAPGGTGELVPTTSLSY